MVSFKPKRDLCTQISKEMVGEPVIPTFKSIDLEVTDGSVIQRLEALPFKQENGGSNPSGPTNTLVVKKCECNQSMYIHMVDGFVRFTGCEPCIVDIRLETGKENEVMIKGRRSRKSMRCITCKRRHLIRTFDEVKDAPRQK